MKKTIMVLALVIALGGMAEATERKCRFKTEVGESLNGLANIYKTTKKLDSTVFSLIDFDKLTIVNAKDGSISKLKKISNNVYTVFTGNHEWFFITNDDETIVTETSITESIIYLRIIFCE